MAIGLPTRLIVRVITHTAARPRLGNSMPVQCLLPISPLQEVH